jgi:hypothetical protein
MTTLREGAEDYLALRRDLGLRPPEEIPIKHF